MIYVLMIIGIILEKDLDKKKKRKKYLNISDLKELMNLQKKL